MEHDPLCELNTCELRHPELLTIGKTPRCMECGESCICDALRSCEQRVGRSLWQECYDAATQTTERNYVWHEKRGYAAALDAAREALTEALNALPIRWTSDELFPAVLTIHQVFDSLKEKP